MSAKPPQHKARTSPPPKPAAPPDPAKTKPPPTKEPEDEDQPQPRRVPADRLEPEFRLENLDRIRDLSGDDQQGDREPVVDNLIGPGAPVDVIDSILKAALADFAMVPAAAASESAALLAQITASLRTDSRVLWYALDTNEREALAADEIRNSLEQRVAATAAARWLLAPDAALFNTIGEADKTVLAKELLQSRAGVAPHQVKRAEARTKLITRTADLMDSIKDDRDTWRETARIGRWAFIGTLAIAALAIVYVLVRTADDMDPWAVPAIVFALAVFAASPAALFLLERPLQGIDTWTPSGESKAKEEEGEAEDDETEEDAKDKPEPKQPSTKVAAKPKGRARGTPR